MALRGLLQAMRHGCSRICFTWGTIFCVLLSRIVGVSMYTVWICDCFFLEFKMGIHCKDFSLYPNPEIISAIWPTIVSCTSLLLIFYASRLPDFPNFKAICIHLRGKKHFYQLCVTLILVIIYDLITVFGGEIQGKRTVAYLTYMLEHITSVALMFTINFVPMFVKNTAYHFRLKTVVYKVTLLVYSIETYDMYALGSTLAVSKLAGVPTLCGLKQVAMKYNISGLFTSGEGDNFCHDATSIVMFLLNLVDLYLRHKLGEFFLTKVFRENNDILDEPLQPTTLQETANISPEEEETENTSLLNPRS